MYQRRITLEQTNFELWCDSGASSKAIDRRIVMRVVDERLTPIQREYLNDYFFKSMTMREIAKAHGVATSTVSRTLCRAKRRLKEALKYSVRR